MIRVTIAAATLATVVAGGARADDLVADADRAFVATMNQQFLFVSRLAGTAAGQGAAPDTRARAAAASTRAAADYARLKRLADKWQIGTPGTLLHGFWEDYDRVVGLSGPPFDTAFDAALQKAGTVQATAAADQGRSGVNPELRAFAAGLAKPPD